jgi:hypothetical protein
MFHTPQELLESVHKLINNQTYEIAYLTNSAIESTHVIDYRREHIMFHIANESSFIDRGCDLVLGFSENPGNITYDDVVIYRSEDFYKTKITFFATPFNIIRRYANVDTTPIEIEFWTHDKFPLVNTEVARMYTNIRLTNAAQALYAMCNMEGFRLLNTPFSYNGLVHEHGITHFPFFVATKNNLNK